MPAEQRLPTSVFVLVGAAVLGAGTLWWTAAGPPAGRGAAPMESVTVITTGDGTVVSYVSGRSTISEAPPVSEQQAVERMVAEMKRRR